MKKMHGVFVGSVLSVVFSMGQVAVGEVVSDTAVMIEEGVPGGVIANVSEIVVKVKAVDAESRKVTLAFSNGEEAEFIAGPEVANFGQIEAGDDLRVTALNTIAIAVQKSDKAQEDAAAAGAELAPIGDKPGLLVGAAADIYATITGIDLAKREATLQLADGTVSDVVVRDDVDLASVSVGDKVRFRVVKALSIVVE